MLQKQEEMKHMEMKKAKETLELENKEESVSMVEQLLLQEINSNKQLNKLNNNQNSDSIQKLDGDVNDSMRAEVAKKMVSFSEDNYVTFRPNRGGRNQQCYIADDNDDDDSTTTVVGADDSGFSDSQLSDGRRTSPAPAFLRGAVGPSWSSAAAPSQLASSCAPTAEECARRCPLR
jgi:hypothetical protein